MMKSNRPLLSLCLLLTLSTLSACINRAPDTLSDEALDDLAPMPAAGESVDDVALANGMEEPAPIDPEVSESQPNPDLWVRLRDGYALDLSVENSRIKAQRDWYARHPQYIMRVTTRAERYLHHIVEQAEARDMPLELALLPVVESAFDPFAYSHGRAAGPWQFIPSTGDYFGLHRSWWQDQRRDVLKSTDAALTYLQKLADRFDGDWLLALASYNAGGGTVSRAIKRNRRAGKPTDFWNLSLPRETSAYVPKLLAIAQIVQDPERYNVALHAIPNEPYFAKVDTHGQIDLAQAARLADISIEELYLLNPAYNRWATSPDGPHHLLVPADRADSFNERLAALPSNERMQWARYTIKPGDNLGSIAQRHRTTAQVLRSVNNLKGNTIIAGRALLIPGPASASSDYSLSADARLAAKQNAPRSGRQKVRYQVRSGDTLWDIARSHQVGVKELARWNNMAPGDSLRIGQTLAIWSKSSSPQATSSSPAAMTRKVNYAVRNGDSLYAIADRFNVSVNDIKDWNQSVARSRYIQPGQRLTLYVDIRQAY